MISKKLEGKTALVTGATRGIGHGIASRLLADGARVIATGTKADGKPPVGSEYIACDFSDEEALSRFAEQVTALSPDIIINNAGINKIDPFDEIDEGDFKRIQLVNVIAPFTVIRAAIPAMKERQWGRILNMCSIWGIISKEKRGSYSTSKFAIDGMTVALAAEVTRYGILANCVSPGFIDTELTRHVLSEEELMRLVAQVPAKRLGQVGEIAALVAWLVGPENTYISGQNIAIDGGFTRV